VGSAQPDVAIIELEPLAAGLTAPLGVTHAGDGSGRQFITDQSGQIWIVEEGNLLPTPFLDISEKLPELNTFFDERGLLGLAFHPSYEENGRFFIRYSSPRDGDPGEPCFDTSRGCHAEILAEYAVSASDPNQADSDSEIILFSVDEPQFNHNAGDVAFGPDGFLYFSLGDGGGAHDGLADDPPSHGPIGNAQNIETPLGAILRIDVDEFTEGSEPTYTIPPTNPFVDKPGLDEIYAYGLRNPFKFSFDDRPGGDGKLYLGDVGQNLFEEVNIIERGGNYGWVIREGFHCFDPFNPGSPPSNCSDTGPLDEPLIDPIVEYAHPESGFMPEGGITVIGGFVYRGEDSPILLGKYIFGDFAQAFTDPSGTLFYIEDPSGENPEMRKFQIGLDDRPYGLFLKGFGEDEDGEIYACGSTELAPVGNTGTCARIVALQRYLLPIIR
jgi:glucose/arabinose dehydrogenase